MSGCPRIFARASGKDRTAIGRDLAKGCEPLGADSQGEPEDSKGGLKTSGGCLGPLVREQPAVGREARPYDGGAGENRFAGFLRVYDKNEGPARLGNGAYAGNTASLFSCGRVAGVGR